MDTCESSVKQLSRQCGTQARPHSQGSPARQSPRMVTNRNRRTPSGNVVPIPANIEAVRESRPGIGNGLGGWKPCQAATSPGDRNMITRFAGTTRYPVMLQGSSRPLSGGQTSKPNRGCLSANKGTREARPSRVIARPVRRMSSQASPTRRTSGGAAVVVRGRESRPHGEGRQYVSFWTAEGFLNREGSR